MGRCLDIIENADGRTNLADDAEERVIEELRQFGKEILEKWAKDEAQKRGDLLLKNGLVVKKKEKKLHWHTTYGTVNLREQVFYHPGLKKSLRVFSSSAGIHCRGYSRILQRTITDFGGEHAFGRVEKKLKEHYGITVPTSSARTITQQHAHEMHEQEEKERPPHSEISHSIILSETDGTMIPMMKTPSKLEGVDRFDARKHKKHFWREARLTLAHAIGSVTPVFAATLEGVDKVGQQIRMCVDKVGRNDNTKIHCVGDGAPWIANQVEDQFGSQASYLVDFYHVCEYLALAAPKCGGEEKKDWVEKQKANLKAGGIGECLQCIETLFGVILCRGL